MPRYFGLRDRHVGLPRVFDLSVVAYFMDFALVPIAAGALLIFARHLDLGLTGIVTATLAGVIAWTLAEYWIHRLVFHGDTPFEPMHDMHHRLPKDMIGLASWSTFIGFTAIWNAAGFLVGAAIGAAFTAGFMLGYLAYCAIHVRMHHGDRAHFTRYVAFMFRHHAGHHRGGAGNFGLTSIVWDVAFRTFKP